MARPDVDMFNSARLGMACVCFIAIAAHGSTVVLSAIAPRFRSHGKEMPKTDESERAFSLILSASIGFPNGFLKVQLSLAL